MESALPTYPAQPAAAAPAPLPFSHPLDFYRLRDFGQKTEAAAAFLRTYARDLGPPLLLYALPVLLFSGVLQGLGNHLQVGNGQHPSAIVGTLIERLGYLMLVAITGCFVRLRMYYPNRAARPTPAETWAETRSQLGVLIGRYFVAGLLLMGATLLLVLPGIYVGVPLSLLGAVMMIERPESPIGRCFSLVEGHWWNSFALAGLCWLLHLLVGGVPLMLLGTVVDLIGSPGAADSLAFNLTVNILSMLLLLVVTPALELLILFHYFHLVEMREHPGLQLQAELLGQEPLPESRPGAADEPYAPGFAPQAAY
ncbi:hypothetical protein [Hymenobacter sp. B81]|uniref:hypothetical protein n=1 Tax=Hymenobacter sp. B81 TaxID=3344878 RepID=UPI0037DCF164